MKKFFDKRSKSKGDKANPASQPPKPTHQGAEGNNQLKKIDSTRSAKKQDGIASAIDKLKIRTQVIERSTGNRPYGAFFLGLPTGVLLLIAQYLKPKDWAHLVLVCRALQPVFQQPIKTLNLSLQKTVIDSRVVPLTIFSDPFFVRFPPDFSEFEKLLKMGGEFLKHLFTLDVQPWEIAALLGMEEALQETHGSGVLELKNTAGIGVLHYYCIGGQKHLIVSHIARYKPFFKAKSEDDYLLAECATFTGQIEVLELLKNNYGFDLTRYNEKRKRTLLHSATTYSQTKTVKWLVSQKVDPKLGENLLVVAALAGSWRIYNYLTTLKLKLEFRSNMNAVLIAASRDGNTKFINMLIQGYGGDLKTVNYQGLDMLAAAISGGKIDMVQYCCDQGWGEITRRWENGISALHVAARAGKIDFIPQLVEKFPDQLSIHMVDDLGQSVLFSAAESVDFDDFIKLAATFERSECLKQDSEGKTIVHVAASCGKLVFLREFVKKFGAECMHVRDHSGRTAIHYAIFSGNITLVEWLVTAHRLSFCEPDNRGKTPLHLFIQSLNADSSIWEDLIPYAEKFGIECFTEYRDSDEKSVKNYLEEANQPKVLSDINAMCRSRAPK